MSENFHPAYVYLNNNINTVAENLSNLKKHFRYLDDLLANCPIVTIPKGSLIFHSNQYNVQDLVNEISTCNQSSHPVRYVNKLRNRGCPDCRMQMPIPSEGTGDKPRIQELIHNQTKYYNGRCTCYKGVQTRMYGNFNPIGNWEINLGSGRPMKGTQVCITSNLMRVIDTSFVSAELGIILKDYRTLNIGHIPSLFRYLEKHNLDGIVMLDSNDSQNMSRGTTDAIWNSANLSCYHNQNNGRNTVLCPEILLRGSLGNGGGYGTGKLKLLGMIDIVDGSGNILPRDRIVQLYNILFQKLVLKISASRGRRPMHMKVKFDRVNTLYKALYLYYLDALGNESAPDWSYIDNLSQIFRDNPRELWIRYNDATVVRGSILAADVNAAPHAVRATAPSGFSGFELFSKINIRKSGAYKLNNPAYSYINQPGVALYASESFMRQIFFMMMPLLREYPKSDIHVLLNPQLLTGSRIVEKIKTFLNKTANEMKAPNFNKMNAKIELDGLLAEAKSVRVAKLAQIIMGAYANKWKTDKFKRFANGLTKDNLVNASKAYLGKMIDRLGSRIYKNPRSGGSAYYYMACLGVLIELNDAAKQKAYLDNNCTFSEFINEAAFAQEVWNIHKNVIHANIIRTWPNAIMTYFSQNIARYSSITGPIGKTLYELMGAINIAIIRYYGTNPPNIWDIKPLVTQRLNSHIRSKVMMYLRSLNILNSDAFDKVYNYDISFHKIIEGSLSQMTNIVALEKTDNFRSVYTAAFDRTYPGYSAYVSNPQFYVSVLKASPEFMQFLNT